MRPALAQHSEAEGELLQRHAAGARCVVELGVAEGASALRLREVLNPAGTLYLIDPYPRRIAPLPSMARIVARRVVAASNRGEVVWIRERSDEVLPRWHRPIDFLFIDADHRYEAVRRDWEQWSRFVRPAGIVAMHDSLRSEWTSSHDGPVRLLDSITSNATGWELIEGVESTAVLRRSA